MAAQTRFRIHGDKYWSHIDKKLRAFGLELRSKKLHFDTRKFQPRVALEGEQKEAVLVLLHDWVTGWVDGHDTGSEAKIDAAIKQVLDRLKNV